MDSSYEKAVHSGACNCMVYGVLSIYSICYLNTHTSIGGTDYLIGVVLMVAGFAIMERGTLYAVNMTFKDVKSNIKKVQNSI